MTKGFVHSLESFGSADGPGVRFIIFLSGCNLRCQYCHNPDTWKAGAGKEYTADELLKRAMRYRAYWKKDGGITVSGGEPLLQIDFLTELFRKAKKQNINTAIDTAGQPFTREEPFYSKWLELMKYTDLVLLDIKHIDDAKHRKLTGRTNENILDMAKALNEIGKPVWIRHVLVPERTDEDESLQKLSDFLAGMDNIERIDVLPYHTLGTFKWKELGVPYQLEGISPPSPERVANAKRILKVDQYLSSSKS